MVYYEGLIDILNEAIKKNINKIKIEEDFEKEIYEDIEIIIFNSVHELRNYKHIGIHLNEKPVWDQINMFYNTAESKTTIVINFDISELFAIVNHESESIFFRDIIFYKSVAFTLINITDTTINKIFFNQCVFLREVDLNLLDEIELIESTIIGKLNFYDIWNKIQIRSCNLGNIYIENHSSRSLSIYFSEFNNLRIVTDLGNLNMDKIEIIESVGNLVSIKGELHDIIYANEFNFTGTDIEVLSVSNAIVDRTIINTDKIMCLEFESIRFNDDLIIFTVPQTIKNKDIIVRGKVLLSDDLIEKLNSKKSETILFEQSDNKEMNYNQILSMYNIVRKVDNKELKLKFMMLKNRYKNRLRKFGTRKFINIIIDLTTGYFTNVKRTVGSMFSIILGFSLVYYIFYEMLNINKPFNFELLFFSSEINKLLDSLYFSIISFTTIGYGDIYPNGMIRFLAGLEGIIGVLTTATVISVIIRKYT